MMNIQAATAKIVSAFLRSSDEVVDPSQVSELISNVGKAFVPTDQPKNAISEMLPDASKLTPGQFNYQLRKIRMAQDPQYAANVRASRKASYERRKAAKQKK